MADTFSIGQYTPVDPEVASKNKMYAGDHHSTVDTSDAEFKRAFDILRLAISARDTEVSHLPDEIWIHGGGIWLRITRKGTIEFGEPCA